MKELQIKTFQLGELQTNCYVVWSTANQAAVIIDPADSGDVLSEFLLEQQLDLTAILLTHGHFDHCLGLLELSLNFAAPSFLHPDDIFLIKQAQHSAQHWLHHAVDPVPLPTDRFDEGQNFKLGDCLLKVVHTPGHTPGSVCVLSENVEHLFVDGLQVYPDTQVIFTGDTLFKGSFPRTDFRYSNVLQLHDSWEKLKLLPKENTILPGHGECCRLGATPLFQQLDQNQMDPTVSVDM